MAKKAKKSLYDAAKVFRDGFTYDPGHSDLDNEQPIHVRVTLGDWRRLDWELRQLESSRDDIPSAC
jgi:hypothetical protein